MTLKKQYLFILFSCIFFPCACFSQNLSLTSTNKKAVKYYQEGLRFYDAKNNPKAVENFSNAIEKDPNFVEAYSMLGYVYADMKEDEKAIDELNKALAINPAFFANNFLIIARLQLETGDYLNAKINFQKFQSTNPQDPDFIKYTEEGLADCDFAVEALKHPVPFNPQNMGDAINTEDAEYFPAITADGQTFLFTRDIKDPNAEEGHQEDFYVSNKSEGKWTTAYNFGAPVNTPLNEGAPTLSADGQILVFAGCDRPNGYGSCDLYYSFRVGNKWTTPRNMGPNINTKNWESQPSLSSDGRTLYFIRGFESGEGIKNQDIYKSILDDEKGWQKATRLSDTINTPGMEESVFIAADNQTLYFSSDGHPGMGGLDIFMSRRLPNGSWGIPVNLGYPINTYKDENSILVDPNGHLAYFASNRQGGFGNLDLYSFELPNEDQPNKITYVKGKVFDSRTHKPLDADFELIDLASAKSVVESQSNVGDGSFLVCLPLNKDYALHVSRKGYLFYSDNFSLKNVDISKPFTLDIPLQPIDTGEVVQLKNIFFETNKYDLKEESRAELGKLITFLNTNPNLKIELSGHTDNVGKAKDNLILSNNRAKSVYDYLIQHGISESRLTYRGYGDTRPITTNDTPENRARNRRTEFKVTGF
ncbi:MAG: OmpA family protein [Bacteroidia bacterium]